MKNEAKSKENSQFYPHTSQRGIRFYLRYGPFSIGIKTIHMQQFKSTHCVVFNKWIFIDSHRCLTPKQISNLFLIKEGTCTYPEHRIQAEDSLSITFCFFFAAYVICKKNYSFSRVVFFQSKIANSFYSKKMTAVGLGKHDSEAVGRGCESLSCQIFLRFLIVTPPPSTLLIHKIFRCQKFSETQKGSPTNFFGTVRQQIFDRKSWYNDCA